MLIPIVEEGLEKYLRAELPLPVDIGDVTFEAPASTWSAQLSRITVNLFLYDVMRSSQPPRPAQSREDATGRTERRGPLPMIEMHYLVSAWAGSPRDEHQLLGDVLNAVLSLGILPPEQMSVPLTSSVQIAVATDERNRPRDLWSALGGNLKAGFTMTVTTASDAVPWQVAAPSIKRIETLTAPIRGRSEADPVIIEGVPMVRRRENGRLVYRPIGDESN